MKVARHIAGPLLEYQMRHSVTGIIVLAALLALLSAAGCKRADNTSAQSDTGMSSSPAAASSAAGASQ
ncbi:hypothetical protein [Paraburkholderia guartelaensis]|uniref:Uncharacterized protein n=1 Tax=Paraburkholderia guartelaensis TaxID=2546446 RepID=A0ABU9S5B9_9BURK